MSDILVLVIGVALGLLVSWWINHDLNRHP